MEFFEEDEDDMNPINHLIAGSFAGVAEHCGMFPIDTIKTHVQATNKKYDGLFNTMRRITEKSGYRGLFRGMGAIAMGSVPSHAAFFGIYEITKFYFGANMAGHHPIETAISGAFASICMDGILTPMDAIKQRMQLGSSYVSTFDCLKKVIAREGVRSLYAGFTTQLTMNVPYHAIFLSSYESFKKFYKSYFNIDEGQYDLLCHITCSILGGMTAGGLTTPLDVAKTRLQTQYEMGNQNHYKGMFNTVVKIYREESFFGLFRGVKERMLFNSFSAAICWTSYEFIKMVLEK